MGNIKTKQHNADVHDFIMSFADTYAKRADSFALLKIMEDFTGLEPKMWGPSMIGFGSYSYKSDRSAQNGEWFLVGFSPRKAAISLYVYSGLKEHAHLLENFGKFKMGKACLYIKKLSDIDEDTLRALMGATISHLKEKWG